MNKRMSAHGFTVPEDSKRVYRMGTCWEPYFNEYLKKVQRASGEQENFIEIGFDCRGRGSSGKLKMAVL
jgi:hypothetical protein